jgi:PAS domain S-box-containing protein
VTEVTNDCLWEWTLASKEFFWIDGGHKRVFGYNIENALIPQRFWENSIHPEDKVRVLKQLRDVTAFGTTDVWMVDYRFKKANGSFAYVRDKGHIIYDGNRRATRIIGATQDITEKVLLTRRLDEERLTRHYAITNAVFTALENERARVGKELSLIQTQELTLAKLYLQMGTKNEKNKDLYLEKSYKFLATVVDEINKVAKTLVAPGKQDGDFFSNIRAFISEQVQLHSIAVSFKTLNIEEDELNVRQQLELFRIIQEQLNNIIQHSKATMATINIFTDEDKLRLSISDNGVGCDLSKVKRGVGIINIRTRAELFQGTVEIICKPNEGYQLKLTIPLVSQI